MALLILLSAVLFGLIIYGTVKRKATLRTVAVIALVLLWIISGIYYYFGLQNPY
jgi:hypothetical protein